MQLFQYAFGFFVCVGPLAAIVVYLMWASRRPQCGHCRHVLQPGDSVCGNCGRPLVDQQASK